MATSVPPNTAPPTTSFWTRPEGFGIAAGCWYVLDCLNAFRTFVSALVGVDVRDVKKFAAGLLVWNDRTGADLKADFEAAAKAEVNFSDCRTVNAMAM